ncbi:MAG: glutaredoxin family protein [Candidatus Magnetomorum sp.]|nr:glutaredoxin family protein [Candidatus Magnetomorum sp.]
MSESVKLYSLSTCSHCKSAKSFLKECNIRFNYTDVDLLTGEERKSAIDNVKQVNPRCSFPTIIIGNTIIIGFKENEIREALGI